MANPNIVSVTSILGGNAGFNLSATATDTDADEGRNTKQKSFQRRRVPDSSATESQSEQGESLPDLDDSDVEDAALKIQSAFRGFQARKNVDTIKKGQKMGDVLHSAMVIQRSFRRYKKKKQERKKAAILLGADPARAEQELRESLNFEIKLATNALPREKRRNASALYFPMTLTELSQQIPLHNWTTYVNKILTEDVLQVQNFEFFLKKSKETYSL